MDAGSRSPTFNRTRTAGSVTSPARQHTLHCSQCVFEGTSSFETVQRAGHQPNGSEANGSPRNGIFQQENRKQPACSHNPPANGSSLEDWTNLQGHPPSDLVAKALPSNEGVLSITTDKDYELQHLRTQVKSIRVIHDLLMDARSEVQELHKVVGELEEQLRKHGVQIEEDIEDRLSRLRLGSTSSMSDTEWSVDLKRPPLSFQNSHYNYADGRDKIVELTQRLAERDAEVHNLEEELAKQQHLMQASEGEQAQEIAHLTERLRDSCRDCQTSGAICRSLNGETELLKGKVQLLMEQCQGLSHELSNWKRKTEMEKNHRTGIGSNTPLSLEEQLQMTKRQLEVLDQEKAQLSGQLKEVMSMNKRWQKYNRQQDRLREDLAKTKLDLEIQIKALEDRCRGYEEMVNKLQKQLQRAKEEQRHQQQGSDPVRKLERRVRQLEGDLARATRDGSKYDGDVIQQQLKQFTDDFQKEHDEKEKLKKENQMLMRNHEEQVDEFSKKVTELDRENRELKQMLYTYGDINYPEIPRERRELVPHGVSRSWPVVSLGDFPTLPRDVQPDGTVPVPQGALFNPHDSNSAPLTSPFSSCSDTKPCSPPASPSPASALPMPESSKRHARGEDILEGGMPASQRPASGWLQRGEDSVDGGGVIRPVHLTSSRRHNNIDESLQCARCLREFPVSKHSDFMRHVALCDDS